MIIVDAHCDTLTLAVTTGQGLLNNRLHWDINRAMQYDGFVQVLAVFQNPDRMKPTFKRAVHYIRQAHSFEINIPYFSLCRSFADIKKGLEEKKVCGLLAIEGGDALEGKTENLQLLYNMGIRCITLTWNYANELGDGAQETRHRGLTPFGRGILRIMQEKGMIIDISHASEKTFWDCMEECSKPLIASHSNARAIHDHPRNLYDSQLLAVAEKGGVIGINFYREFISSAGSVNISCLVRHIEYICGLAGDNAVGIGADFDGMESLPDSVFGVQSLGLLLNELKRLNYSDCTIQKIYGGNFLRVFNDVLK